MLENGVLEKKYDVLEQNSTDQKEVREAKAEIKRILKCGTITFDERIGRILTKLAIGHAVYELSNGYYSLEWDGIPYCVRYTFRSSMSEGAWDDLEYAEVMNDKILPEQGSRGFRNIYVFSINLKSINTDHEHNMGICMMDWTDIQDGIYKYIAYFDEYDKMVVKLILMDFLYAEVVFQRKSDSMMIIYE